MKIKILSFRRTRARFYLALALLSPFINLLTPRCTAAFTDANWVSMGTRFTGPNTIAEATAVDAAGNLYIGGSFTNVCGVAANSVAKWNGTNWSALGAGLRFGPYGAEPHVYGLAVVGNDLYACGTFTNAGGVIVKGLAKWNGSAWSALGAGVDGQAYAFAVSGPNLFVGGSFTTAGGISATNIAKWNGSTWSALGSGVGGTFAYDFDAVGVLVMAASGNDLYVGGHFSKAGGISATNIAKWNGSAWSALGPGLYGAILNNRGPSVYALAISGSDVYAGGDFFWAGNTHTGTAAKWNGSSWSALGDAPTDVYTMAVQGSDLYAGGPGGSFDNGIFKWNGVNWSPVGDGLVGDVSFLSASGTNVYAVGNFSHIRGEIDWRYVAKWDGNRWSELGAGPGINHDVTAMVTSGNDLYVSGKFDAVGEKIANHIAKWDGANWSTLGSGLNLDAKALATTSNEIYATDTNAVLCWNGSAWSLIGLAISEISQYPEVSSLATISNDVYVGGRFTLINGTHATNIAKWNGSTWSALGPGRQWWSVFSLKASGNDLYVGGEVLDDVGNIHPRVAKWNGGSWTVLGTGEYDGPGSAPYTLNITDHFVYAGGWNRVYKWNGTNWTELPLVVDNSIKALATFGDDLYIGGDFPSVTFPPNPAQVPRNFIAKWDGANLTSLGSGMGFSVNGLAILGNALYAGGSFTTAGGKSSTYLAKAIIAATGGRFQNPTFSPINGFGCTFTDGSVGYPYHIQASPTMAPGSWVNFTNFTYTTPVVIRDASAASKTNRFFRAVTP